ncbi:MAG: MobP3 family relaxase, partial [Clostridia bacterium]
MFVLRAPVVFKLKWVSGARAGGRASVHARYIATREGVARAEEDRPDLTIHARYLDERPGSTGLFGQDPSRPPSLEAVQTEVSARHWHWQAVISLREEDATALGLRTPPDWRDLTRRVMPQFALYSGIAEADLRWVGAVHRKAGQPHVHLLAWLADGAPPRQPRLQRPELRDIRRVIARELYGPLRAQLAAERTAQRDLLVAAGRYNLTLLRRVDLEAQAESPTGGVLPPAFPRADLTELGHRIMALSAQMPDHGRLALAYMPPAVREEVRSIADWILSRPTLASAVDGLREATRSLTALYTAQPQAADAAWARAHPDVR